MSQTTWPGNAFRNVQGRQHLNLQHDNKLSNPFLVLYRLGLDDSKGRMKLIFCHNHFSQFSLFKDLINSMALMCMLEATFLPKAFFLVMPPVTFASDQLLVHLFWTSSGPSQVIRLEISIINEANF